VECHRYSFGPSPSSQIYFRFGPSESTDRQGGSGGGGGAQAELGDGRLAVVDAVHGLGHGDHSHGNRDHNLADPAVLLEGSRPPSSPGHAFNTLDLFSLLAYSTIMRRFFGSLQQAYSFCTYVYLFL
jgi:hypothetical protein